MARSMLFADQLADWISSGSNENLCLLSIKVSSDSQPSKQINSRGRSMLIVNDPDA